MAEGKMPVVVGGTHYYIEALLWKVLVSDGAATAGADTVEPQGLRARLRLLLEELEFTIMSSYDRIGLVNSSYLWSQYLAVS